MLDNNNNSKADISATTTIHTLQIQSNDDNNNDYNNNQLVKWPYKNYSIFINKCIFGPINDFYVYIFHIMLLIVNYIICQIFTITIYYHIYNNLLLTIVLSIINILLCITTLYKLLRTTLTDSGILPINNDKTKTIIYNTYGSVINHITTTTKYCTTCNIHVDYTTRHCNECNTCIVQYDHHCPWMSNCIGLRNYKLFVTYLYAITTYITYVLTLNIYIIIDYALRHSDNVNTHYNSNYVIDTIVNNAVIVIQSIILIVLFITCISLTCYHTYLVVHKLTAYTHSKLKHYKRNIQYNHNHYNEYAQYIHDSMQYTYKQLIYNLYYFIFKSQYYDRILQFDNDGYIINHTVLANNQQQKLISSSTRQTEITPSTQQTNVSSSLSFMPQSQNNNIQAALVSTYNNYNNNNNNSAIITIDAFDDDQDAHSFSEERYLDNDDDVTLYNNHSNLTINLL